MRAKSTQSNHRPAGHECINFEIVYNFNFIRQDLESRIYYTVNTLRKIFLHPAGRTAHFTTAHRAGTYVKSTSLTGQKKKTFLINLECNNDWKKRDSLKDLEQLTGHDGGRRRGSKNRRRTSGRAYVGRAAAAGWTHGRTGSAAHGDRLLWSDLYIISRASVSCNEP